jgi:photoactive yellow protein
MALLPSENELGGWRVFMSTNHHAEPLSFDQADLLDQLNAMDDAALDLVTFGVIGFDDQGMVRRYGAAESRMAGLGRHQTVGLPLFSVVAQCMNNFLVAQRFDDSQAAGLALDETVDYVLTLRMKPVRVKLRLLSAPAQALRYVCILRLG